MTAPVMIMAGGTGGHIFPALAVAASLRARAVPVVWLGSRGGMETRLVPRHGIPLVEVSVSGLRGKGGLALMAAPFRLLLALMQALRAQIRHRPRAVLGMGGFAAGPGGVAAWLLRKPLYIHEQNAIPGMTNRYLARLSRVVMQGFPGSFPAARAVTVGNPVRQALLALADPAERLGARRGPLRVLIIGGSLGALKLNRVVPEALAGLPVRVDVWHQCGARHLQETEGGYERAGLTARIEPFIDDMAEAYGWADVVIARAGALTVSEIAQVGLASILVPYPHAVDDHQTANAMNLVSRGAARHIADAVLTPRRLQQELGPLLEDRGRLLAMAQAATALRRPDAAEVVAGICLGEIDPSGMAGEGGA